MAAEVTPSTMGVQDRSPLRVQLAVIAAVVWALGALASRWFGVWVGIGGAAALLGLAVLVYERPLLRKLLAPTAGRIALGLLGALVQIAFTYTLYPVFSRFWPDLAKGTHELYVMLGATTALGPLLIIPLVIVSEELVWRGVVQQALCERISGPLALAVGSLVYATCHLGAAHPLLALLALVCGLYWSAWRWATGSILVPLLAHFLWDFCVFILAPLVRV